MTAMIDERPKTFPEYFAALGDEPTHFILGVQGSGTNFLSRLMRATLKFSVVTDRSLIFNAAVEVHKNPTNECAARQAKKVCQSLFPGPIRKRLLSKHYALQNRNYIGIEQYADAAVTPSAYDFANFFYTYHAFVNNAKHKAVKSDDIWENIEYLNAVVPNRRIILLARDPRDIALSIRNKFHFGPREIYEAAKYVKHRLDIYTAYLNETPDRVICVKYEEMLVDPMPSVQRLAGFVGAAVDERAPQAIEAMKIKRANFDKWKTLKPADLAAVESVLRDNIRRLGYEPATEEGGEPSPLSKAGRYLKDKALRVPQKLLIQTQRLVGR